ncbi:DUF6502 family protein [Rhodopila sp.]|jgi:hypothetical protein|uniref:DUF6502 family protein n=1 Tax=Rhodopila sp. TaxID=2480087 RepID=UPI002B99EBE4|nr:DUF6502 family protein [Rhodopila sp.]HVZ06940.1 DUF6502 family protein [Rhodopila sp.]
MPPAENPVPVAPGALLAACRRLLRPLVVMMIRSGVTLPVLNDMLRALYVDVAATEILTDPKARSDSRISLVTGIHRKEIRRLRDIPPELTETPEVVTVSSQIIARWLAMPPFTDEAGRPRPLPRTGNGAAHPDGARSSPEAATSSPASFESLVASVTSDIRSRVVLDDWLSKGVVRIDDHDRVVLNADAFIPRPGADEQLFYFARNLQDHAAAAVANISAAEKAPFLDRSVHYDGLSATQAIELEAYARAEAIRVLLEVNRRAASVAGEGVVPAPAGRRVNLGIYLYTDVEPRDGASAAPAAGSEAS